MTAILECEDHVEISRGPLYFPEVRRPEVHTVCTKPGACILILPTLLKHAIAG